MPKDSASTQTVEDPQHSEQESVTAEEELTDDQIWESAGKPPVEDQPEEEQEEEVIEVASSDSEEESEDAEAETFETEAHSEEVSEEDTEEEPKKHNYEKRYKDLEKEFHKRNEETKELREQFQQLRLERLEEQRELERLRSQRTQDTQEPKTQTSKEPSPLDEDWLDGDTKQTLEDFSELTAAYKKLMAQEIAKAMSNKGDNSEQIQKIAELEKVAQDYQERAYWQQHAAEMRTAIGNDFLEIDQSQEFSDYVHSSPLRETIMTKSRDWNDHIAVMKDFLETPVGKAKFRAEPEEPVPPPPEAEQKPSESNQPNKGTVRRQAAQGLLKNSSPRQERRPEDMNDEELWDSIAL